MKRRKKIVGGKIISVLRPLVYQRKFQAYGVGTAKTGTHSISGMFEAKYRAAHEPESERVLRVILDSANGSINEEQRIEFIKKRDKRLWLEMESSLLNFYFLDILVTEFPQAKFIMTIRDCYSWLASIINHQLTYPASGNWVKLRELNYQTDKFEHTKEEQVLAERGLYTIDGYLSSWADRNKKILATVPKERLLIVKTDEITQSIPTIARFMEIPVDNLDASKSDSFKAIREEFDILSHINTKFLRQKVDIHCKDLMDEYFPEVRQYFS